MDNGAGAKHVGQKDVIGNKSRTYSAGRICAPVLNFKQYIKFMKTF